MRIGIIGTGTIASAVVRGVAGGGHQITVSERSARHAQALAEEFDNVAVASNQEVIDRSDIILVALIAEAAPNILRDLSFRAEQQVISLMGGASLTTVATMIAPARASAIMLPFPGIASGGSPVLVQGDGDLVRSLVTSANTVYMIKNDAEMAAYISAQAVLSPVARLVEDTTAWLAARVADPERGDAFLRHLVASSLADTPAGKVVEALNTPGGFNQRLRQSLEESGMREALRDGLDRLETKE
ncbi:pyrroline-5-carboxylate reductase (plasmid) [Pseudosulfitobacter pseudonitzschiae]|uniref:Pyrroline-5-carboxylate reductase n=1 Tax=Pseudosulfitobacter pseudonitzschiae TaxID=1402135 RepID=A0A221K9E9_9RHOB|nr:NAD(P)-binding domain-containing protein [Pseudosulfitobacter pseudonitzschiae]ASM75632.1 pyrroline-5-carboxylate reductase [Pseudosulfitobacter pseudonitzschiae]